MCGWTPITARLKICSLATAENSHAMGPSAVVKQCHFALSVCSSIALNIIKVLGRSSLK